MSWLYGDAGVTEVIRTAAKEHKCAYKSRDGHMIKPGDKYAEVSMAPWTRIPDDVDDEGRTISSELGHWEHVRYHNVCMLEVELGIE